MSLNVAQFKYKLIRTWNFLLIAAKWPLMIFKWQSNWKTIWCHESQNLWSWLAPNRYQLQTWVSYLKVQTTSLPAMGKTSGNPILYSIFSFSSWECLTSNVASAPHSPPKPKDSAAAPAPGRNSSQAAPSPSQAQAAAGSHQLSVGPAHNSAGPSPHTVRRGKSPPPSLVPLGRDMHTSLGQRSGQAEKFSGWWFHICCKVASRNTSR